MDNRSGKNAAAALKNLKTRSGKSLTTIVHPQKGDVQVLTTRHGFDNLYHLPRRQKPHKILDAKSATLGKTNQKFVLQMSTMDSVEARYPGQPTAFFARYR